MKALTWQGRRDVRVEEVPDPEVVEPTDAVIRVTSSGICGSDLHLYEVLGAFLSPGDVLGHEAMGVVEEVGGEAARHVRPGDRVVVPFNISCGDCWMCRHGLYAQCETTQVVREGKGAALFGYTRLYGQVPGGQAEYLRVPQSQFGPIKVPEGPPDDRFVYLSDVLPTAWQAVVYADIPAGGSVAVYGLGPIGQLCTRIARLQGAESVFGVDLVPERLLMARKHGEHVVDEREVHDVPGYLAAQTDGRGPDSVIDAVGMEAHGDPVQQLGQKAVGLLPDRLGAPVTEKFGIDRLGVFIDCVRTVRRGGTVSLSGVYGGAMDPLPMLDMFDKGIQLRMGQCHVKRWVDDILPYVLDDSDPLDVTALASHHLPLADAPHGYDIFQRKEDGCVKVLLTP